MRSSDGRRANGGAAAGVRPRPRAAVIHLNIGATARATLSILALQDAVAERIDQETAAARLLARLIEAERQRRLA